MKSWMPIVILIVLSLGAAYVVRRQSRPTPVNLRALEMIAGEAMSGVDKLGQQAVRVSEAKETEVGDELTAHVLQHHQIVAGTYSAAYVEAVGQRLLGSVERPGMRYRFYLVAGGQPGAFALPGGSVFITTTMLARISSEAELAFVLGHEIAHIDRRHCIERLQYGLAARRLGGSPLEGAVRIGYELYREGYDKEIELEADHLGLSLAAAAGYHPGEAAGFFTRLRSLDPEVGLVASSPDEEVALALGRSIRDYLRSHPYPRERALQVDRLVRILKDRDETRRYYIGRRNYQRRFTRDQVEFAEEFATL